MTKLPAIIEARVAGTGLASRPCVDTYITTRPVRVETTTYSTDSQGNRSESRTWHNATDTHVSRFASSKLVNTAVAETDAGATFAFDTDDHVMRVGETVYLIGHSATGSKAIDVVSPRLQRWLTEIHVQRHRNLAILVCALAASIVYAAGRPIDDVLLVGAVAWGATALLEATLAQVRTIMFARSRKRALKTLRAAGIDV